MISGEKGALRDCLNTRATRTVEADRGLLLRPCILYQLGVHPAEWQHTGSRSEIRLPTSKWKGPLLVVPVARGRHSGNDAGAGGRREEARDGPIEVRRKERRRRRRIQGPRVRPKDRRNTGQDRLLERRHRP